jgi:hypothetical protein
MHVERDPTRIGDAYLVGRNAADPAILARKSFLGGEVTAAKEFSHQNGEPDCVLGREMEGDAMVGLAQERLACDLGREHARLGFHTELALETAVACNYARGEC